MRFNTYYKITQKLLKKHVKQKTSVCLEMIMWHQFHAMAKQLNVSNASNGPVHVL